jgi:hypothetical protein
VNELKDFGFSLRSVPELVRGVSRVTSADLPFEFSDVVQIKEFAGKFTPNNDQVLIGTVPAGMTPSFVLLIVDKVCQVYGNAESGAVLFEVPVKNLLALSLEPSTTRELLNVYVRGQTSLDPPMEQAVEVNWYLLFVEATVTLPEEE